jgi:chromosome transmission fidelity protein 1
MSDYKNHLFSYLPPERLDTFSYGHVIPKANLVAQSLTRGLLGSDFDFTYEARGSEKMVSTPATGSRCAVNSMIPNRRYRSPT